MPPGPHSQACFPSGKERARALTNCSKLAQSRLFHGTRHRTAFDAQRLTGSFTTSPLRHGGPLSPRQRACSLPAPPPAPPQTGRERAWRPRVTAGVRRAQWRRCVCRQPCSPPGIWHCPAAPAPALSPLSPSRKGSVSCAAVLRPAHTCPTRFITGASLLSVWIQAQIFLEKGAVRSLRTTKKTKQLSLYTGTLENNSVINKAKAQD